jgi:hypothetical protein
MNKHIFLEVIESRISLIFFSHSQVQDKNENKNLKVLSFSGVSIFLMVIFL